MKSEPSKGEADPLSEWSDEELNRKIAELRGEHYHRPTEAEIARGSYYQYEPRYAADLNTMHEAEKALTFDQQMDYLEHLATICRPDVGWSPEVHATARQRAEAFVATLTGKDVEKGN